MLTREIGDAESLQPEDGRFAEGDGCIRCQKRTGDERADYYACYQNEVPRFAFPIVLQEIQIVGDDCGAHVSKRRAHAEGAVEENQMQRDHQSNDRSGHVPWPRLTDPINEI